MKTFTSTIISNEIQYYGYGNISVFLANGGVMSIADIQSASYTKSENDTLLLLKADKTQLIDSFSKSETYASDEVYAKREDDALLLLKAEKLIHTQKEKPIICPRTKLINQQLIKIETDQIISQVENTYFTQSEVDAKLTNYVNTVNNQSINGTKTFNASVSAIDFAKAGKDDASVLLDGSGDRILSSFGGIEDLSSSAFSVITYIPFPNSIIDKGGYVAITHLIECLQEFQELYAYIHELESKPIVDGIINQIIVRPQYFQDQLKENDVKLSVQPLLPITITPMPVAAEVTTVQ
ncbi:MAG: hypothetical protein EZS28_046681, partial [Streblomastix strix]